MSASVDPCLFLYFQDDLAYHYVLVSQETFVRYDQTIANDVGPKYSTTVFNKYKKIKVHTSISSSSFLLKDILKKILYVCTFS
jgi:hypothetical protein